MDKKVKKMLKGLTGYYTDDEKIIISKCGKNNFNQQYLNDLLVKIISEKYDEEPVKRFLLYISHSEFKDILKYADKDGNNLPMLAIKTGYSINLVKYMYCNRNMNFDVNHLNNHDETIIHMILKSDILNHAENITDFDLLYSILNRKEFNLNAIDDNHKSIMDVLNDQIAKAAVAKKGSFYDILIEFREKLCLEHIDLLMTQLSDNDEENFNVINKSINISMIYHIDSLIVKCSGIEEDLALKSVKRLLRQITLNKNSFSDDFSIDTLGCDLLTWSFIKGKSEKFILPVLEELFNYGFSVNNCHEIVNYALLNDYSGSVYNIYQYFLNKGFEPLINMFEIVDIVYHHINDNKEQLENNDTKNILMEFEKYKFIKKFQQLCKSNDIELLVDNIDSWNRIYSLVVRLHVIIQRQYSLSDMVKIDFMELIVEQALENQKNSLNNERLIITEETVASLVQDFFYRYYNECIDEIKTYKLHGGK